MSLAMSWEKLDSRKAKHAEREDHTERDEVKMKDRGNCERTAENSVKGRRVCEEYSEGVLN